MIMTNQTNEPNTPETLISIVTVGIESSWKMTSAYRWPSYGENNGNDHAKSCNPPSTRLLDHIRFMVDRIQFKNMAVDEKTTGTLPQPDGRDGELRK